MDVGVRSEQDPVAAAAGSFAAAAATNILVAAAVNSTQHLYFAAASSTDEASTEAPQQDSTFSAGRTSIFSILLHLFLVCRSTALSARRAVLVGLRHGLHGIESVKQMLVSAALRTRLGWKAPRPEGTPRRAERSGPKHKAGQQKRSQFAEYASRRTRLVRSLAVLVA